VERINYIVTAGGTRELIDEVRYIGNLSTGRLGSCIADEAFGRGHAVSFIHGPGSFMPSCESRIITDGFTTVSDLKTVLMDRVAAANPPVVVVHAAAVADFIPKKAEGKISSDREELVIRMSRAEKIVDLIKTWNPRVCLVKFKLESNRGRDELLHIGIEAGLVSGADLVVANDTGTVKGADEHQALIIRADGTHVESRGKKKIAETIVRETEIAVLSAKPED